MLLRDYRTTAQGVPDLLEYAALVDDGILLLKSGGLLTGFIYQGPDLAAATPEQLSVLSAQINHCLLSLGDGWMLHADAIRRSIVGYPTGGAFPDATSRAIDAERADH